MFAFNVQVAVVIVSGQLIRCQDDRRINIQRCILIYINVEYKTLQSYELSHQCDHMPRQRHDHSSEGLVLNAFGVHPPLRK